LTTPLENDGHMTDSTIEARQQSPQTSARSLRPWLAGACALAAILLVGGGSVGHFNPGGHVWVGRLLDHPFVFGVVALALLGAAVYLALPARPGLGLFVACSCFFGAIAWAQAGTMLNDFDAQEVAAVSAPPALGVRYEVVVRSTSDGYIDPAWTLSIRQTSRGILNREWYVGCISGDAPWNSFKHVQWESPARLKVILQRGSAGVVVDRASGAPLERLGGVWGEC
jgi:hypothetical protein